MYSAFSGLMQSIQNFGMAIATMFAGMIVDRHGYIWLEIFFIFWLIIAAVCTVLMWLIDVHGDKYLNMTMKQRTKFDDDKVRQEEERKRIELEKKIEKRQLQEAQNIRKRYVLFLEALKDDLRYCLKNNTIS